MNFATWYDCGLTFSSGTRTCTCTLLATIDIHIYTCTPEKESSHPWAMGDTHNRIRVHVEGFHGLYIFYTFRILHEYKISSRQHPTPNMRSFPWEAILHSAIVQRMCPALQVLVPQLRDAISIVPLVLGVSEVTYMYSQWWNT